MSEMLEFRDLGNGLRRRWWIPLLLTAVGAAVGVYAAANLSPVYRSQGTVLVGPIDSTVTRSTTLRASESLAVFYADLARREIVLVPVREQLGLSMSLDDLRNSVSAAVPDQNPRVVSVTVQGESDAQARSIALEIVHELVSLSPAPEGSREPAFASGQAIDLETTIKQTEQEIDALQARFTGATDRDVRSRIGQKLAAKQQFLNDSRQTYVELMALEPDSDAGGLQVLDDVAGVTPAGRPGATTGATVGGTVGAVLGLVAVWLLNRRDRRPPAVPVPTREGPTQGLVLNPTNGIPSRRVRRSPPRRTVPPGRGPRQRVIG